MHRAALFVLVLGCPTAEEPLPPAPFLGADPAVPAGAGEVRAGVVRDGEAGERALFGGINAEGRAGDVKIYNDRVQFIVQAPRRSHGIVDVGGGLIDADLVRGDVLGRDTLEDAFLSFSLARLAHAESLEIVADGSAGGAAVVRAVGQDVPWDFMQGLFELPEPNLPDLHLRIEHEYRLEPGSYSLRMITRLTNEGPEPLELSPRDGLIASGEDLLPWAPDHGLAGPSDPQLEAVGVVGRQGEASLSLWPSEGLLNSSGVDQLAAGLGIVALSHPETELAPGETRTLDRFWTLAPDILTAEGERWAHQGRPLASISGQALDPDNEPIPGVRIFFTRDDAVAGFALTDAEGRYATELPPGAWTAYAVARAPAEHVQLPPGAGRTGPFASPLVNAAQLAALRDAPAAAPLPYATGRRTPPPTQLTLPDTAELDFTLPARSSIHVDVTDDAERPLPAVVELRSTGPSTSEVPEPLRRALGVEHPPHTWAWTADGQLDLPAIPGEYSLHAGHSWRHGQQLVNLTLAEGEAATVSITLPEEVPADGWLSLDPHLHGAPSFDGALSMEARLVACAAAGVDLPVMTDHDRMADYRPLASALGLDERMHVVQGVEVTTIVRGHFNLYPVDPRPGELNGGAEPWWITPRDTQELFDRMQASAPGALTQVNHPRSPGMFALAQLDSLAEPRNPELWSWDFELFELLNGGVEGLDVLRQDWFGLLNAGRIRVPVGASDSHYAYIPCGHGRTDVLLDVDNPQDASPDAIREALLAGHVVVAGGTTLRATLDLSTTLLPGDTGVGTEGSLSIRVDAPPWMEPGTLRVYRNGAVVHEEPVTGDLPFDVQIPMSTPDDAWFAVEVEGTESLGPLWRDFTPYAMTNAFFVDADGDGWDAPGP